MFKLVMSAFIVIRKKIKLLINNGISFKSGGNLHNKLFSFSGTKKYKSKKTKNKKVNCCGLEFLKFVNIIYFYLNLKFH